jgi:hypothetical protein
MVHVLYHSKKHGKPHLFAISNLCFSHTSFHGDIYVWEKRRGATQIRRAPFTGPRACGIIGMSFKFLSYFKEPPGGLSRQDARVKDGQGGRFGGRKVVFSLGNSGFCAYTDWPFPTFSFLNIDFGGLLIGKNGNRKKQKP